MNKKGNLPTAVFVLLTMAVLVSTIFLFVISSSKTEGKIYEVLFLDNFYSLEKNSEFVLNQALEQALVKTYSEIATSGDYIGGSPVLVQNNYFRFDDLSNNLDYEFVDFLKKNLMSDFEKRTFQEEILNVLKSRIVGGNFVMSKNSDAYSASIDGVQISQAVTGLSVSYYPEIKTGENLSLLGLQSFESVYGFKEKCADQTNLGEQKACYWVNVGMLQNCDVAIREEGPEESRFLVITLTTKKEFLVDNKFEKISFEFVPG